MSGVAAERLLQDPSGQGPGSGATGLLLSRHLEVWDPNASPLSQQLPSLCEDNSDVAASIHHGPGEQHAVPIADTVVVTAHGMETSRPGPRQVFVNPPGPCAEMTGLFLHTISTLG